MRATVQILAPWLLLAAACGDVKLQSRWLDRPVAVDGREDEWLGEFTYLTHVPLGVAARNDATRLYLCLSTRNRQLQLQLLRRGLTVWIDPGGGKEKRLGVRFPLDALSGAEADAAASTPPERSGAATLPAFDPAKHPLFELLRDGGETGTRVRRDAVQGFELAIVSAPARLVYELKLPLLVAVSRTGPAEPDWAIGAPPGGWIGVGLETAAIDLQTPDSPVPRRGPRGSEPRGPGRPGGRPGSDRPPLGRAARVFAAEERQTPAKRFEIWARLQLAVPPATAR
jgi:hypothetical protein